MTRSPVRGYDVVVVDWKEVIATFATREAAEAHADRLDGLALRCYVRAAPFDDEAASSAAPSAPKERSS